MDRDYLPIVEQWIRNFIDTMDSSIKEGRASPGEDFGDIPKGIKIIFDGYGYNEKNDNEDDINFISFAVFIHKTSFSEYFPPHESNFNLILHRPEEECCIHVWYNVKENVIDVLPFEDSDPTQLNNDLIIDIIFKVNARDPYIAG